MNMYDWAKQPETLVESCIRQWTATSISHDLQTGRPRETR